MDANIENCERMEVYEGMQTFLQSYKDKKY